MTTIGRIIDLSSNNHPAGAPPINWAAVKGAGVTTAIIKATEGTGYTNPFYAGDMAGAISVGIDVLAYHFMGNGAAWNEAMFFYSVAGRYARILDVETAKNVPWDRTFLQTLGWAPDQCMVYGSASTLVDIYQQLPARAWPAAYDQGYPGWGVLWQFTDKATIPGITGPVDENQWHGSEIQYETLFGLLEPPPPIPSQPSQEDYIVGDSVALANGTIVSHAVGRDGTPIAGHYLEITREAGKQGQPATDGLSIIDITAAYSEFPVAP
jgi:GH25 family lysozyme M1 (1,4-beta-N-acetylmuramidase)